MPWLALPFSDTKAKEKLDQLFDVESIPALILLDQKCKTITADGVDLIKAYGAEAYPFSKERLVELRAEEDANRLSQPLNSLFMSADRDFFITSGGRNVLVSELVGKTVRLYFSAHWCPPCKGFTPQLIKFYSDLKNQGRTWRSFLFPVTEMKSPYKNILEACHGLLCLTETEWRKLCHDTLKLKASQP
ncbi:hypothetical protein KI387_021094 [Taxus chinensis]|uniref:protein-disulfide reductase n=1 Tax=Taxus chinensis TaxID=29808 RepID=A0AA38LEV2_TAXCH|nr:hypothetical protein KI387_021094 [Taxus chinensis]